MNKKIKINKGQTACEVEFPHHQNAGGNKSRIMRYRGDSKWTSVKIERYKKDRESWSMVTRQVLTGNRSESAKFHLRYFEIASGGYSSLEKHKHEHVIICVRGKGKVILDNKRYSVGYLDVIYVSPNTIHQLVNPFNEPFGFFCIVNSNRDRPKLIQEKATNQKMLSKYVCS